MSWIFGDSFDTYSTLTEKWTTNIAALIDLTGTKSRTGIGACACFPFGPTYSFTARANLVAGTAYNTGALNNDILAFQSGPTRQVRAQVQGDGSIKLLTGNDPFPTTIGQTAAGLIATGVYNYIELKATSFGPGASVVLRINGQVQLNVTANTDPAGTGTADTFYVFGPGGGLIAYHDDVYLCDLSGAQNNDFLGAIRAFAQVPNADSVPLQWTPSTPGPHFSLLTTIPPPGGATYVQDATVGDQDLYKFPTTGIVAPVSILAVQVNLSAALDIAGSRSIAASINGHLGTPKGLTTSYAYVVDAYELNPVTGAPFQLTDFPSLNIGPEVTA